MNESIVGYMLVTNQKKRIGIRYCICENKGQETRDKEQGNRDYEVIVGTGRDLSLVKHFAVQLAPTDLIR